MGVLLGTLLEILRVLASAPSASEEAGPYIDAPTSSDVSDDAIVGPPALIEDCEARLDAAGIVYSPSAIPVHENRSGLVCGAEQVVRVRTGPEGISWRGRPKVTCPVALAMGRMEAIVQEEAMRHLGRRVVRIEHLGTYNCREMAAYPGWVSEHSYANAIDVKAFVLQGGRRVSVLDHWTGDEPNARFLREVARRLYDENVFSVVLTPAFDRAHRNHFHLDFARYRVDGTARFGP